MAMSDLPPVKKSLGQHWLNDSTSLEAMCQAAEVGKDDVILEIGPGPGSLTELLVERAHQVVAVEFDRNLAEELPKNLPAKNLVVINQDILSFDLSELPGGYKVAANIPYYLTSNLIRVLSESANPPMLAALLVQKEVAERVAAEPGAMSILSVTAQFYWQVSLGREVPAKLFTPPPKVDSQVLILKRRTKPLFPEVDPKSFFRIVKAGFSAKRKTLQNSLSAGLRIDKNQALKLLNASGINPQTRAQELSLDDWKNIYEQTKVI